MNDLEKRYQMEQEIDILDFIRTLMLHKKLIAVTTVVMMVVALVGGKIYNSSKSSNSIIVAFNYPEISKGLNPDKSKFEPTKEIISLAALNEILNKYKEEDALKNITSVDAFRGEFKITPIFPKNIQAEIQKAKKDGKEYVYIPKEYEVSTKLSPEILTSAVNASIEDFEQNYRPNQDIVRFQDVKLNTHADYNDRYEMMKVQLDKVATIMKDRGRDTYVANNYGYSFQKINHEIKILQKIELEKYFSYFSLNNLSLHIDAQNIKTKNEIKVLSQEIHTLRDKAAFLKGIINDNRPKSKNIMISGVSAMDEKVNTRDSFYEELLNKYIDVNNEIIEKENMILELQTKLQSKYVYPNLKEQTRLDALSDYIVAQTNNIIKQINNINDEYIRAVYSNMMKVNSPIVTSYYGKPLILFLIAGMVLGLFMGIFGAFALEFKDEYLKKFKK